jgi:hypothetical protein
VPGLSINVLAWLRPQQIKVHYAGRQWALEASTAADWLGAIAADFDDLSGVFPGTISDSDIDPMLESLKIVDNHAGIVDVARSVVQAAGGRDWWWTVNLTRKAVGSWIYFNGILVRQGVRADSIGLPDWLDACYTFLWEREDENAKVALDLELSTPPLGIGMSAARTRRMLAEFAAD